MSFFENRIPKYRTLLLKAILFINTIGFLTALFYSPKGLIITLLIMNFALSGTCLLMDKFGAVFNMVLGANKVTKGLNKVLESYG